MNTKHWLTVIALLFNPCTATQAGAAEPEATDATTKLQAAKERQLVLDAEIKALEEEIAKAAANKDGTRAQRELTKAMKELAETIKAMPVTSPAIADDRGSEMLAAPECQAVLGTSPNGISGYKAALQKLLNNAAMRQPYEKWAFPSENSAQKTADDLESFKASVQCAKRLYAEASIETAKLPQSTTTVAQAADKVAAASIKETYAEIAHLDVYSRPQATLLLGPSFVLRGDGQLRGGVETTLLFDGGPKSFFGIGRTFTDVSFQSKGMLGTLPIPDSGATPNSVLDQQFSKDKGYFRFNTGISTQLFTDRISLALTGGLNAIPREGQEFLESLRERYTTTLVTRTFLSQGIYTRFSVGGAYDKSWRYFNAVPVTTPATVVTQADQRESYARAIVNMELFLPQTSGLPGGISAAARLSLDTPINGDGPSEVRLSILAYLDFVDFFSALNPLYKAPN